MGQLIVFQKEDGGAAVMSLAPGIEAEPIAESLPGNPKNFIVDSADFPNVGAALLNVDFDSQTIAVLPPDMDAIRSQALAAVKERHATDLRQLSGDYSPEERDTWMMQIDWAKRYIAAPDEATGALLSGLLGPTAAAAITSNEGDPASVMAETILGKNTQFQTLVSMANGLKAEANLAINEANTPEELALVLEQLKTKEVDTKAAFAAEVP